MMTRDELVAVLVADDWCDQKHARRLAEALEAALSTFRDRLDGLPDDASGDLALPDARAAFAAALTGTPSRGEEGR